MRFRAHSSLIADMTLQQVHSQALDAVVNQIVEYRSEIHLATDDGIEVLTEHGLRRYMIDIARNGKYSVTLR